MSQTPVWTGGTSPNRLFPSQTDTKVGIGTSSPYNQAWSQLTIQNSKFKHKRCSGIQHDYKQSKLGNSKC